MYALDRAGVHGAALERQCDLVEGQRRRRGRRGGHRRHDGDVLLGRQRHDLRRVPGDRDV